MRIREWDSADDYLARAKAALARFEDYPTRVRRPRVQQPLHAERPARGVYELQSAPPGRRAFHLVSSDGNVGYVDFPEHWASRDLVRNLWRRLDREDPPQADLRIIRASDPI